MEKKVHLISNAHLDPVWQWEWEEGAAAAVSTFRCAARFCREFGTYIFCHNEAMLYRWIEEYEPALFREIQDLVRLGRWHIMGGWYLQPDCNMPSGEAFVRQIQEGRRYFKEKFNVVPSTAINFDSFGHTRGLVQILAKSGYDSYLFCRPSEGWCHLPANDFRWVGYDGSSVLARRSDEGYGTGLGHAVDKIRASIDGGNGYCLWGVGDHGGGPSEKDIRDINALIAEYKEKGIEVVHSTPEAYFADRVGKEAPDFEASLHTWAPGCYTSQARVKQKYRKLENELFSCEKMCSACAGVPGFVYPEREIGEAVYDLLTVQFHDALPGSSIQPVEEMAFRMLDHGLENLSRLKARAFFALCHGQKAAKEGEIPVCVYNPHPYPVEGDFACEFMLADQNWKDEFTLPEVYRGDEKIPSQCEKETSNLPLDWRKRVVFHAVLGPMQMNRFDCRLRTLPKKPVPTMATGTDNESDCYLFDNGHLRAAISKKTGLLVSCTVDGVPQLNVDALRIEVMKDNEDPWGMTVNHWTEKIGEFKLLSPEEGTRLSAVPEIIPSVRVIEDGEVRTVVESVFGYETSRAVMRLLFSKQSARIDMELRMINSEKKVMFKLDLPTTYEAPCAIGETAYGEEKLPGGGLENVSQKYIRVEGGKPGQTLNLYNEGIYGSSFENGALKMTLMRAPGYTAHPIGDRRILPADRHSAYAEQGERLFCFSLSFGHEENARHALSFNEQPMALSFFPSGEGSEAPRALPYCLLEGRDVVLTALKKAADGRGTVIRLFNPAPEVRRVHLLLPDYKVNETLTIPRFAVQSYRLYNNALTPCELMEGLI